MKHQLSSLVTLYQKERRPDGLGGYTPHWISLGTAWATLKAYGWPYAHEKGHGLAYEIILRHDLRVALVDKVQWEGQDYFPLSSPEQIDHNYLRLKVFCWKNP